MKNVSLYWAVACLLICCLRLDAVQVKVSTADSSGEHNPFRIQSAIGLGFGGFQHDVSFKMQDEVGFEYDTMSMLMHQKVKSQLGIERDQFDEIAWISMNRTKKLNAIVGREILGFISDNDDIKNLAEEAFLAGESEMREFLTDEQIEGLEQMRVQLAIEKLGAAAALEASDVRERFGLTDSDLETVRERTSGFDQQVAEYRANELSIANRKLLDKARKLASGRSVELESLLGDLELESFLRTPLFPSNDPRRKLRISQPDLTRLTKLKSVREKVKISDAQFEQITELRAKLRENSASESQTLVKLDEILDKDQCQKLDQIVVVRELSRVGTVNALTRGFVAGQLEYTKDQADELFDFGVELQEAIKQNVVARKSELVRESFSDLPKDRRQALIESIGSFDR